MTSEQRLELCVAGLVYFEVFVPGTRTPEAGQELFVENIRLGLGGALNTASVASALGLNVLLAHPQGDGLSDIAIAQRINQLNIPSLNWSAKNDPAISLVFSGKQDRAFVSAADFKALLSCTTLPTAQWIHVPGLLEARYLAEPLAKARAAGAMISVSGSWAPEELTALQNHDTQPWDLLILNEKEASFAVQDSQHALSKLQGAASSIVVTAGQKGAFGLLNGIKVSCSGKPVAVKDFTGAGDAFCAGLLASIIQGREGDAALGYACQVAARLLTQIGGVVEDPALLKDLESGS